MNLKQKKVLVIDDELQILKLCKRALEKIGILTDTAESAEEGLGLMKEFAYSLILTDIMLPGMTGIELLRIVKEKFSTTRVIVMTAMPLPQVRKKAMETGAYDFLAKPFEILELREAIKKAFEE